MTSATSPAGCPRPAPCRWPESSTDSGRADRSAGTSCGSDTAAAHTRRRAARPARRRPPPDRRPAAIVITSKSAHAGRGRSPGHLRQRARRRRRRIGAVLELHDDAPRAKICDGATAARRSAPRRARSTGSPGTSCAAEAAVDARQRRLVERRSTAPGQRPPAGRLDAQPRAAASAAARPATTGRAERRARVDVDMARDPRSGRPLDSTASSARRRRSGRPSAPWQAGRRWRPASARGRRGWRRPIPARHERRAEEDQRHVLVVAVRRAVGGGAAAGRGPARDEDPVPRGHEREVAAAARDEAGAASPAPPGRSTSSVAEAGVHDGRHAGQRSSAAMRRAHAVSP